MINNFPSSSEPFPIKFLEIAITVSDEFSTEQKALGSFREVSLFFDTNTLNSLSDDSKKFVNILSEMHKTLNLPEPKTESSLSLPNNSLILEKISVSFFNG